MFIVCFLYVSASFVATVREVHYKGHITKLFEQMHKYKILSCKNVWFKIYSVEKLHAHTS